MSRCSGSTIRGLTAAALTGLSLVVAPASAQTTVSIGAVSLEATMASISVVAPYFGDDDVDSVAHVEYRVSGAGPFLRGHGVVRLAGRRYVGSVLLLAAATGYDVRVVIDDPDNGGPVQSEATITTRTDTPAAATGTDWHVDATTGSDANPGTLALPFATIQAGADAAQPGDTVHVHPGLYREHVIPPRGGAPGVPIRFVAEGPGVVIDGSDPGLETGAAWRDEGGGRYSTPWVGASLYAAVDDARIYDYQALADLVAENGNIATPGIFPGGFFIDAAGGRLHVITPDHTDPAGHAIHVATRRSGFLVDTVTDVVIEGFEIRYMNEVGVDIRDSARCWVRGNVIHHSGAGVRVRRSLASANVIERNSVRDTSVYGWPWSSSKAHTPEASAISITDGHGNVVRWNQLEGTFNGVYTGAFGDANEDIARDTDVYGNTMRFIGDDGLELEGAQRNVRAWGNVVRDVYNAISLAPIEVGPAFLLRNILWGYSGHALKVNNGTYGWVFIYHTTAMPLAGAIAPAAQAIEPTIPFGAITSRNNIWEANRYVIEYGGTSLLGPIDWDRDDLYTADVGGAGRFVKWLNVRYADLAALAASATIEANGFALQPVYESAPTGDFRLVVGHGLLDVGEVIAGINDRVIVGAGPDVGAVERGAGGGGPAILRSDAAPELAAIPDDRFADVLLPWLDPDNPLANPAWPPLLFYALEGSTARIGLVRRADTVQLDLLP